MTMAPRWRPYCWREPRPIAPQELEKLERQWGVKFPAEYTHVASAYQGMTPEPCAFDVGGGNDVFNALLPILKDEEARVCSVQEAQEALAPHLPAGIHPFANTPGGEFICFDYRNSPEQPRVVHVSVELTITPVAESFRDFLEGLYDA
jgi:hypothetical protein